MEEITVTELRGNLYKVVDDVLRTGKPRVIVRGKAKLRLSPIKSAQAPAGEKQSVWDKLRKMGERKSPTIRCSDDELIYGKLTRWNEPGNL